MATYWYEPMSASDRPFLVFEGPNTHMHVGGVAIFDGESLTNAAGGIDIERIRTYVWSRLHYIPRYRQRLSYVPIENYPVWIDDGAINPHFHVRHASLPRPGDDRQLKRMAARILSQRLDRDRPLWEAWIVEGLEGGRFALILKTHHCVVDGVSGVDLLSVLLRPFADSTFEDPPTWIPRPAPSPVEMLRDQLARRLAAPFNLLRDAVQSVSNLPTDFEHLQARFLENAAATLDFIGVGLRRPAATPHNKPIGPYRRVDSTRLDLDAVKAVKNRLGGTVNDVVLATVSGAMRHYLLHQGCDVDDLDYKTVVPVNIRGADELGATGNRVAAWMLSLPIDEDDPLRRYMRVCQTTARIKRNKQAQGVAVLSQVAELGDTIMTLGIRLAARLHPYNLIVSNVVGPPVPLYLLGARLLEGYPAVPLFEYQGLGIATLSYDGNLFWGLNADWDLVPDLHEIAKALASSFDELHRAALGAPVEPSSPAPKRRRRRTNRGRSPKQKHPSGDVAESSGSDGEPPSSGFGPGSGI